MTDTDATATTSRRDTTEHVRQHRRASEDEKHHDVIPCSTEVFETSSSSRSSLIPFYSCQLYLLALQQWRHLIVCREKTGWEELWSWQPPEEEGKPCSTSLDTAAQFFPPAEILSVTTVQKADLIDALSNREKAYLFERRITAFLEQRFAACRQSRQSAMLSLQLGSWCTLRYHQYRHQRAQGQQFRGRDAVANSSSASLTERLSSATLRHEGEIMKRHLDAVSIALHHEQWIQLNLACRAVLCELERGLGLRDQELVSCYFLSNEQADRLAFQSDWTNPGQRGSRSERRRKVPRRISVDRSDSGSIDDGDGKRGDTTPHPSVEDESQLTELLALLLWIDPVSVHTFAALNTKGMLPSRLYFKRFYRLTLVTTMHSSSSSTMERLPPRDAGKPAAQRAQSFGLTTQAQVPTSSEAHRSDLNGRLELLAFPNLYVFLDVTTPASTMLTVTDRSEQHKKTLNTEDNDDSERCSRVDSVAVLSSTERATLQHLAQRQAYHGWSLSVVSPSFELHPFSHYRAYHACLHTFRRCSPLTPVQETPFAQKLGSLLASPKSTHPLPVTTTREGPVAQAELTAAQWKHDRKSSEHDNSSPHPRQHHWGDRFRRFHPRSVGSSVKKQWITQRLMPSTSSPLQLKQQHSRHRLEESSCDASQGARDHDAAKGGESSSSSTPGFRTEEDKLPTQTSDAALAHGSTSALQQQLSDSTLHRLGQDMDDDDPSALRLESTERLNRSMLGGGGSFLAGGVSTGIKLGSNPGTFVHATLYDAVHINLYIKSWLSQPLPFSTILVRLRVVSESLRQQRCQLYHSESSYLEPTVLPDAKASCGAQKAMGSAALLSAEENESSFFAASEEASQNHRMFLQFKPSEKQQWTLIPGISRLTLTCHLPRVGLLALDKIYIVCRNCILSQAVGDLPNIPTLLNCFEDIQALKQRADDVHDDSVALSRSCNPLYGASNPTVRWRRRFPDAPEASPLPGGLLQYFMNCPLLKVNYPGSEWFSVTIERVMVPAVASLSRHTVSFVKIYVRHRRQSDASLAVTEAVALNVEQETSLEETRLLAFGWGLATVTAIDGRSQDLFSTSAKVPILLTEDEGLRGGHLWDTSLISRTSMQRYPLERAASLSPLGATSFQTSPSPKRHWLVLPPFSKVCEIEVPVVPLKMRAWNKSNCWGTACACGTNLLGDESDVRWIQAGLSSLLLRRYPSNREMGGSGSSRQMGVLSDKQCETASTLHPHCDYVSPYGAQGGPPTSNQVPPPVVRDTSNSSVQPHPHPPTYTVTPTRRAQHRHELATSPDALLSSRWRTGLVEDDASGPVSLGRTGTTTAEPRRILPTELQSLCQDNGTHPQVLMRQPVPQTKVLSSGASLTFHMRATIRFRLQADLQTTGHNEQQQSADTNSVNDTSQPPRVSSSRSDLKATDSKLRSSSLQGHNKGGRHGALRQRVHVATAQFVTLGPAAGLVKPETTRNNGTAEPIPDMVLSPHGSDTPTTTPLPDASHLTTSHHDWFYATSSVRVALDDAIHLTHVKHLTPSGTVCFHQVGLRVKGTSAKPLLMHITEAKITAPPGWSGVSEFLGIPEGSFQERDGVFTRLYFPSSNETTQDEEQTSDDVAFATGLMCCASRQQYTLLARMATPCEDASSVCHTLTVRFHIWPTSEAPDTEATAVPIMIKRHRALINAFLRRMCFPILLDEEHDMAMMSAMDRTPPPPFGFVLELPLQSLSPHPVATLTVVVSYEIPERLHSAASPKAAALLGVPFPLRFTYKNARDVSPRGVCAMCCRAGVDPCPPLGACGTSRASATDADVGRRVSTAVGSHRLTGRTHNDCCAGRGERRTPFGSVTNRGLEIAMGVVSPRLTGCIHDRHSRLLYSVAALLSCDSCPSLMSSLMWSNTSQLRDSAARVVSHLPARNVLGRPHALEQDAQHLRSHTLSSVERVLFFFQRPSSRALSCMW